MLVTILGVARIQTMLATKPACQVHNQFPVQALTDPTGFVVWLQIN